jgi:hypothetical protein
MRPYEGDPDTFVRENQDILVNILKNVDDEFVRALVLAALVEFGDTPLLEDVIREMESMQQRRE